MPRRVRLATLLAFALHGYLVLTAQYRLSFDAYTHMFFADHYRMDWWSLWDPRWYTGFSVVSYPPLVHQLMGLLGHLIGVDAAFGLVLWAVLTAYPVAVYAFSRVFSGRAVAGYAALGAALLPSLYLAGHGFGQLPTLTATLFALFGIATMAEFLRQGDRLSGALGVALFAVVMAAHHATLLFLPWSIAGVVLHLFLNKKVGLRSLLIRLLIFLPLAGVAGLVVIWPFWAWGLGQSIQVPIDHLSRHNFLADPAAITVFFLPMYGLLMFLIPYTLWKGLQKRYTGLSLAFLGLFILGLGGTTPLPRVLFGAGWEWLTYDRFAFWASLMLLPFLGVAVISFRHGLPKYPARGVKLHIGRPRKWATGCVFILLGAVAMTIGVLPTFMPFEPATVDMQPIVNFLAEENHSNWRYVTFGFGDQMAYLSRLTKATTIDGSYHTARSLPELRNSGIAQIDSAYWMVNGMRALPPILQKSGARGVRWGFVDGLHYIPILMYNGWVKLTTLSNNIEVWENPRAVLPPPVQPPAEDPLAVFSWGVLPLFSLGIAGALAALRLWASAAQRALLGVQAFATGLLPIGLSFWYFRTLAVIDHPGVYFTYNNALFFVSDALALAAFLAWGIAHAFGPHEEVTLQFQPVPLRIETWLCGLCMLASLSSLWSLDWRVSLFFSLHLWLAFGLFLTLQDRPASWRAFAIGSIVALILQAGLGFWEFAAQTTALLAPFGMNWPGSVQPATQGASVVQLADGTRWLRVYGSLPHPNILGGLVFVLLAGIISLYLVNAKTRYLLLPVIAAGLVLLVLTFARSAWVALAVFGLILAVCYRQFDRKRLLTIAATTLASLVITALPLRQLIFTRTGGGAAVDTETFSTAARSWLAGQGLQFFLERPFSGWGIGSFIIELSRRAGYGYIIEPVHNIPLLILSELGIGGALLLAGLAATIVLHLLRARRTLRAETILFSALVLGLGAIAMFDHYLWTLAPGQLLLGSALGLFAGQVRLG